MGFGLPLPAVSKYEVLGAGTGTGTSVAAGNGSKGSYTTIGTTSFGYDGFYLFQTGLNAGRFRIDLAANKGGSDQVIAADLIADHVAANNGAPMCLPVRVPTGAIIKVRAQNSAAGSLSVLIVGYLSEARTLPGFSRIVSCTDFTGSDPTNQITLNGTTQTGWVQFCASTPNRIGGLLPFFTNAGQTIVSARLLFDIGFGSAGNEKKLLTMFLSNVNAGSGDKSNQPGGLWYPCDIPAGTRLSARGQASGADAQIIGIGACGLAA